MTRRRDEGLEREKPFTQTSLRLQSSVTRPLPGWTVEALDGQECGSREHREQIDGERERGGMHRLPGPVGTER